jgi:WD40 repeat protein
VAVETRPALRVRGWDVEQRRLIFDRRYDAIVPVQTALARRDEGLIAMTEDSLLRINLRSGEIRDRWPCDGRDVSCVVANPDGALLAIGRKNRTLTLMDLATGEVRQTLHGHLGRLERLEFSADGRTLLAFDVRGDLRFWHVDSGSELLTLPSAATIKAFDLSADGRWLAIARSGEIEVLDMEAVSILP